MSNSTSSVARVRRAAQSSRAASGAALDMLLTDASDPESASQRFLRPTLAARTALRLARRPGRVARRVGGLTAELGRVAAGQSELAPAAKDKRFADPAWEGNPMLRRALQGYLALGETADGLIQDADLDWRAERTARFVTGNVLDAISPTNFALSNPAVLKETIDRGGANLLVGGRRLARDVVNRRLPATVDTSRFHVGEELASTRGQVVLRTEVFELLHYAPATEQVHEVPLLVVPPTINKFYILDLAPGRSIVEHLLGAGMQVFLMSWRNPGAEQAHLDMDAYAAAIDEARAAVAAISGQDAVHVNAACSGGLVAAGLAGHLAKEERLDELASLTLLVCALDNEQAGTAGALTSRETAAAAVAASQQRGYLDGEALAGVFAWLRPNDLVWGYVVNNYLLGKPLPAFDILYWNQDSVRLAAGLHRDFIEIAMENAIVRPDACDVLGSPVDLTEVDLDVYCVAGLNDHLVPWENAYRGAQRFAGSRRFVLSTSGHIQALINPPGPESKSSFRVVDDGEETAEDFLEAVEPTKGSWWPDYVAWLTARSGELVDAPAGLGDEEHPPLGRAPGRYVHTS